MFRFDGTRVILVINLCGRRLASQLRTKDAVLWDNLLGECDPMLIQLSLALLTLTSPAGRERPLRVDLNPPRVFRSDILTDVGRLVRFLRSRGVEPVVLTNRNWTMSDNRNTVRSRPFIRSGSCG